LVAVKPKGVLSNVFVDLQPGPRGNPPLGNQPFFALDQTQSPVGLDELSNLFDPSVRDSIRTQLQEGVLALGGDGASNLNQTLYYANPLTRDAIPVTYVLAQRSPQLDKLNFEFNTISAEIAKEDANLRPLIVNLNTLLAALAARETDLQGTLDNAAGFFTKLDTALASVTVPDPKNADSMSDLARFFSQGPQALSCAATISTYFTPLVQQVNPHISSLDVLLGEFVTATGYNSAQPPPGSSQKAAVDTLRVDATLPPQNDGATGNGGLKQEHGGSFLEGTPLGFPATISVPNFSNTCAAPAALAGVTP
jgi:ABC-type transporter Mla subunit MlaD